jgi:hypothetical protein
MIPATASAWSTEILRLGRDDALYWIADGRLTDATDHARRAHGGPDCAQHCLSDSAA